MRPDALPRSVALSMTAGGVLALVAAPGCSGVSPNVVFGEGGPSAAADAPFDSAADAPFGDGATAEGSDDDAQDAPSGVDAEAASGVDGPQNALDAASSRDAMEGTREAGPTDARSEADAAGAGDASRSLPDASGGDASCPTLMTPLTQGGAGASSGFGGTTQAYNALAGISCVTPSDCVAPCVAAGGTMASCASGSTCVLGEAPEGLGCDPPSYWLTPSLAVSALDNTSSAATLTLVPTSYFDALLVTDFGLAVPDGATIRGIRFDVRRATDCVDGEDKAIQVLQNGAPVGDNHRQVGVIWPGNLTYTTYGGPNDTWGVSWTPADVRARGFGISITPEFTMAYSNDLAYVDSVRVTVFYALCN